MAAYTKVLLVTANVGSIFEDVSLGSNLDPLAFALRIGIGICSLIV